MTSTVDAADPRTRHYGDFYGVSDTPPEGEITLVIGNCQAESLRIVLDGGLATVRMPAIHELTAADLPYLDAWLAKTRVLVTQPVHDDYHGMPLGSTQLAARLAPGARVVRVPVIRFAGLYPAAALVRPPADPSLVPPVVEYHDLRTLTEAAVRAGLADAPLPALHSAAVHAIAALSLGELRRREAGHETVPVSDLFATPSFAQMRTMNHPGNAVWAEVAVRVQSALGLPEHAADPGRPLLDRVHAPREQAVIDAFGLDAEPTDDWTIAGERVPAAAVRDAHLRWYAERPEVVAAGLARHEDALRMLARA
jgi:Polysaccharide biosynthesis enzyme WcbI